MSVASVREGVGNACGSICATMELSVGVEPTIDEST
jgi:hypothetical protein